MLGQISPIIEALITASEAGTLGSGGDGDED